MQRHTDSSTLFLFAAEFIISLAEANKRLDKFKKALEENGGDQFAVSPDFSVLKIKPPCQ